MASSLCLAGPTLAQDLPPAEPWDGDAMQCPDGTERFDATSPDGQYSAQWCALVRGAQVARHGPYMERFADGRTLRQGVYFKGLQAGRWIRWNADGTVARDHLIWPGESSPYIPAPEDLCPGGTQRQRSTGHDHKRRMWSKCRKVGDDGERTLEGPYVTWDEIRDAEGVRYALRRFMEYQDGERHGRHRDFEGDFGQEVMVEDETFDQGRLHGESRAYFIDGTLRELRHYDQGRFHGRRIGYDKEGRERWRLVYEHGRVVSSEGDLTIGGEPCPERTTPMISADGREEFCAERTYHFVQRHGPFLERDAEGRIVQRGLYTRGDKTEIWQGDDSGLEPQVEDDVLVAEVQLLLGETPYLRLNSPPPPPPHPYEVVWQDYRDGKINREELARLLQEIDRQSDAARSEERASADGGALQGGDGASQDVEASATTSAGGDVELGHGLPQSDGAEAEPGDVFKIWFRDLDSRKYPSARTEVEDGRIRIFGLPPGNYYMRVEIDANRSNPMQFPGDLTSSSRFTVEAREVTSFEAPLAYTLHLIKPYDNNEDIPGWENPCGEEDILPGVLRVAWNAPEEDADDIEYTYRVRRTGCQPYRPKGVVVEGTTLGTSVTFELPPSRPGESYQLTLVARRGGEVIGQLMTFGGGGHGWHLGFRTGP